MEKKWAFILLMTKLEMKDTAGISLVSEVLNNQVSISLQVRTSSNTMLS